MHVWLELQFVTDDFASVHANDIESVRREVSILCEKKGTFTFVGHLAILESVWFNEMNTKYIASHFCYCNMYNSPVLPLLEAVLPVSLSEMVTDVQETGQFFTWKEQVVNWELYQKKSCLH